MKSLHPITVINKHHGTNEAKIGEYIGRGSPLGNPFSHQEKTAAPHKTDTREESVYRYKVWLQFNIQWGEPSIIAELNRLHAIAQDRPLNLVCFCAPKACHGDVIREIIINATELET